METVQSGPIAVWQEYRDSREHSVNLVIESVASVVLKVHVRVVRGGLVHSHRESYIEPLGDFCVQIQGSVESLVIVIAVSENTLLVFVTD